MSEYELARQKAALFDVSERGKIELTGADAVKFLHNLCTNDILNLPVGAGCEAFLCTVKAKAVAHLLVYRAPESLWLDTAPGTAEKVWKHLDHYLISEQVEIADRTGDFAQFHVAGPEADAVLHRAADGPVALSGHQHMLLSIGDGEPCFVRRNDALGLPGFDVLCPVKQTEGVWRCLTDAGAGAAHAETYHILRVEAGTPLFGVDIDEDRFVVEVGRITQAICYTKGCYLGQEPIVMARDRGHVNRAFRGLQMPGDSPLAAGTKLLRDGAEVGQVTSSVVSPRLGVIALAYLRRGSWDPGTQVQVEGDARTAAVASLPFPE